MNITFTEEEKQANMITSFVHGSGEGKMVELFDARKDKSTKPRILLIAQAHFFGKYEYWGFINAKPIIHSLIGYQNGWYKNIYELVKIDEE